MGKQSEKKLRGSEGFEEYYSLLFGARWPCLKEALLKEASPVPFCCPPPSEGKTLPSYYLDSASVLCALTLPLDGAKSILDMCAAPGGKTLVLSSRMGEDAILVSNERSFERSQRLRRVVQEHLPDQVKSRVRVTCGDGAVLCKKTSDQYDAILLDAPCSSERHVLNDKKYLDKWSPSRIKSLSMEQWALLSSAYRLLKAGGYLLYSTCALDRAENSGVVGRLLKKFPDSKALSKSQVLLFQESQAKKNPALFGGIKLPSFEEEDIGFSILPDAQGGAGPIYFCLVQKGV